MNKEQIIKRCRELRRNSTESEQELWRYIRNRRINGLKFLRQHPIIHNTKKYELLYFIADFYCAEKSIVIELDGKIHDHQKEYDENRDLIIKDLGINVVRFKNEDLYKAIDFIRGL